MEESERKKEKLFNRLLFSIYAYLMSMRALRFLPFLLLEKAHFWASPLFWWEKSESFSYSVSCVVMGNENVNRETKSLAHNPKSFTLGCILWGVMIVWTLRKGTLTLTRNWLSSLLHLQNITFVARHVSTGIISIHQLHSISCRKLSAQMEFACDES